MTPFGQRLLLMFTFYAIASWAFYLHSAMFWIAYLFGTILLHSLLSSKMLFANILLNVGLLYYIPLESAKSLWIGVLILLVSSLVFWTRNYVKPKEKTNEIIQESTENKRDVYEEQIAYANSVNAKPFTVIKGGRI